MAERKKTWVSSARRMAETVQGLARPGVPPTDEAAWSRRSGPRDAGTAGRTTSPAPQPATVAADSLASLVAQIRGFAARLDELTSTVTALRRTVDDRLTAQVEFQEGAAAQLADAVAGQRAITEATLVGLQGDLTSSDDRLQRVATRVEAIATDVTTITKATLDRASGVDAALVEAVARLEERLTAVDEQLRSSVAADDESARSAASSIEGLEQRLLAAVEERLAAVGDQVRSSVAAGDESARLLASSVEGLEQRLLATVGEWVRSSVAAGDESARSAASSVQGLEQRLLAAVEEHLASVGEWVRSSVAAGDESLRSAASSVQGLEQRLLTAVEERLASVDEQLRSLAAAGADDDGPSPVLDAVAHVSGRLNAVEQRLMAVLDDQGRQAPVLEALARVEERLAFAAEATPDDSRDQVVLDAVARLESRLEAVDDHVRALVVAGEDDGQTAAVQEAAAQLAAQLTGLEERVLAAASAPPTDDRDRLVLDTLSNVEEQLLAIPGHIDKRVADAYGSPLLDGLTSLHDVVTQLAVVGAAAPTASQLDGIEQAITVVEEKLHALGVPSPPPPVDLGPIERELATLRDLVEVVIDTIPGSSAGSADDSANRVADAVAARVNLDDIAQHVATVVSARLPEPAPEPEPVGPQVEAVQSELRDLGGRLDAVTQQVQDVAQRIDGYAATASAAGEHADAEITSTRAQTEAFLAEVRQTQLAFGGLLSRMAERFESLEAPPPPAAPSPVADGGDVAAALLDAVADIDDRLGALDERLAQAVSAPPPAPDHTDALADVVARLASVEALLAAPTPPAEAPVNDDLAELARAQASTEELLRGVTARLDELRAAPAAAAAPRAPASESESDLAGLVLDVLSNVDERLDALQRDGVAAAPDGDRGEERALLADVVARLDAIESGLRTPPPAPVVAAPAEAPEAGGAVLGALADLRSLVEVVIDSMPESSEGSGGDVAPRVAEAVAAALDIDAIATRVADRVEQRFEVVEEPPA